MAAFQLWKTKAKDQIDQREGDDRADPQIGEGLALRLGAPLEAVLEAVFRLKFRKRAFLQAGNDLIGLRDARRDVACDGDGGDAVAALQNRKRPLLAHVDHILEPDGGASGACGSQDRAGRPHPTVKSTRRTRIETSSSPRANRIGMVPS